MVGVSEDADSFPHCNHEINHLTTDEILDLNSSVLRSTSPTIGPTVACFYSYILYVGPRYRWNHTVLPKDGALSLLKIQ